MNWRHGGSKNIQYSCNEQLPFCMLWVAVYLTKWVHVLSICADVRLFKKKKNRMYGSLFTQLKTFFCEASKVRVIIINLPDFWKQSFSTEKILWNSILLSRNCEIITQILYLWMATNVFLNRWLIFDLFYFIYIFIKSSDYFSKTLLCFVCKI